ncbi:441_t:CDS:2, partial [Acaulospora morrowiae]
MFSFRPVRVTTRYARLFPRTKVPFALSNTQTALSDVLIINKIHPQIDRPRLLSLTSKVPAEQTTPFSTKLRNFISGSFGIIAGLFLFEYYYDSRASIHKYVIMPILRTVVDPERSHNLAVWVAKWRLTPKDKIPDDEKLSVKVFRKKITNPV